MYKYYYKILILRYTHFYIYDFKEEGFIIHIKQQQQNKYITSKITHMTQIRSIILLHITNIYNKKHISLSNIHIIIILLIILRKVSPIKKRNNKKIYVFI